MKRAPQSQPVAYRMAPMVRSRRGPMQCDICAAEVSEGTQIDVTPFPRELPDGTTEPREVVSIRICDGCNDRLRLVVP